MCRYQTPLSLHIPLLNSLQSTLSSQALTCIQFKLLTYAPWQICLPHQTSKSHCTSNTVCMKMPYYYTCMSNKTTNSNFICHTVSIYVPAINMPLMPHANYFKCRYVTTMSVYLPHMNSMQWTMGPSPLAYIHSTLLGYSPEPICLPYCTFVPLYFYCSLYTYPTILHTSITNQISATYINQSWAKYVPGTKMPLKYHTYATGPNCLMCTYEENGPICIIYKKLPWSKLWSVRRATDSLQLHKLIHQIS